MDEPRFNKYFQKKIQESEKLELKKIDYIIALLENISRHLSS